MAPLLSEVSRALGLSAAGVLAVAGVTKLARPAQSVVALTTFGLPGRAALVRGLATLEVALAVAYIVAPGEVVQLGMAATFGLFTALTAYVLYSKGTHAPCGCFGSTEARYSPVHLAFNGVLGTNLLLGSVLDAPRRLPTHHLPTTLAYAALVGISIYTARLLLVEFDGLRSRA